MVYMGYLQTEIDDQFQFVQDLERWVDRTGEPVGATVTMRSVTVAIHLNKGLNSHSICIIRLFNKENHIINFPQLPTFCG